MREFSDSALKDADILLYVTDVADNCEKNADFLEKVKHIGNKTFVIINKIDLIDEQRLLKLVDFWHTALPEAEIVPISAQERFGISQLLKRIVELLPESPPYFAHELGADAQRFQPREVIGAVHAHGGHGQRRATQLTQHSLDRKSVV